MKVKICGLKRNEDIDMVNQLNPDFIGFVFAGEKHKITFEQAKTLKSCLKPSIQAVGVFINEPIDNILSLVEKGIIDCIQLHGKEPNTYISSLKSKAHSSIIKAFTPESFSLANTCPADFILLDNGQGTGESFNWDLTTTINRPFFLAGGINENNIKKAISINPFAIDISSGVETNGEKDYKKMKILIDPIRKK